MKSSRLCILLAGLLAAIFSISAAPVDRVRAHVAWLADSGLEGRRSGQPGAVKAAQYILEQFKQAGFETQMQEFSGNRRNVVARYGKAARHVLIGAHYDGQAGMPSASDNAAGVALLIEMARDLKRMNLPVSVVAIAFDDEEQGLNGSRHYVDNPVFPLESVSAAIIFDTLGRSFVDLKRMTLFVLGSEYSKELTTVVGKRSRPDMLVAGADLIGARSDFAPFAARKVPFLFFSHATHKDYHGAGDRPELLNYTKLVQDANVIGQIAADIARLKAAPAYLEQPVYPPSEIATLRRIMMAVKTERPDLPEVYRTVFDDMDKRVETDPSRQTLNVAASMLLAAATPRLSSFMLDFVVAPAYERENKPEIVRALRAESLRQQR